MDSRKMWEVQEVVMLADGEKSHNCLEGDRFPSADMYLSLQAIYMFGLEGAEMKIPKIPTLCVCGCGGTVWRGNQYLHGHNMKLAEVKNRLRLTIDKQIPPERRGKLKHFPKGYIPWNKKPVVKKQCLQCLKKYEVKPCREDSRFCSHKCMAKYNNLGKVKSDKHKRSLSGSLRGKFCGEQSPAWKGGISFEPYCPKFNKQLKERIRERDNHTCQLCGIKENGKKLHIHHIHYDKPNCNPDLTSLCHSCHGKVGFNREHWEQYFTDLLSKRGLLCQ